jgi:CheY-like chemotaxis protein
MNRPADRSGRSNGTAAAVPLSYEQLFTAPLKKLMPYKIRQVLLVASLYDFFIIEEDGRLSDLLGAAYKQRDLGYVPMLHRVSSAQAAIEALGESRYDLVVSILRMGDMDPFTFGHRIKEAQPDLPVVLLAFNTPELQRLLELNDRRSIDQIFVWQGDGKILLGIIQSIEDLKNAPADTQNVGVHNLLLIEDSPHFYSMYLPILFDELWDQTNQLLQEEMTFEQRNLRQRARPKVHLATTYEQAETVFEAFQNNLIGVVSDVQFPRGGRPDSEAGLAFVQMVQRRTPHLPVLLQSSEPDLDQAARRLGVDFLLKSSHTLTADLRRFLHERLGFGELAIRDGQGHSIARINRLPALMSALETVPDDVLMRILRQGDIHRWLIAHTEFRLACQFDQPAITGGGNPAEVRRLLRREWEDYQRKAQRGGIVRFTRTTYDGFCRFMRLGPGSLGGKARGLAFSDKLLSEHLPENEYPGVQIAIPKTLVIGTDVFDAFMAGNNLWEFAARESSDRLIASRFINADLPPTIVGDLRDLIRHVKVPLAVRSSSLLEDALYQPFAGIYATKMIPNNHADTDSRFRDLANAVKLVFASTFFRKAKAYIESTNHRIEEEKMAVIIQEVVGRNHRERFYPDFSGVACSYNYYPAGYARPEDGVVSLALGLGKTVVDGGAVLRYCPAYPRVIPQFGTIRDMLNHSQQDFYAINMREFFSRAYDDEDQFLLHLPLKAAEQDGALRHLASTFVAREDRVNDGINAEGPRIITFAHILKNEVMPLSPILKRLLALAADAMGCPIEMEFAVTLDPEKALPAHFGLLQVRPMVVSDELVTVELDGLDPAAAVCFSTQVLGNGVFREIGDIVYVKTEGFTAANTPRIALEVDRLNQQLRAEQRPYILAGPGRWGSSDPWLGIPVHWGQINGAKVIIEVSLPQLNVDPSQGSHFFQNITSLRIGYFTVPMNPAEGRIDWGWLDALPPVQETQHLRHVRVEPPLEVHIDGRIGHGVIFKSARPAE